MSSAGRDRSKRSRTASATAASLALEAFWQQEKAAQVPTLVTSYEACCDLLLAEIQAEQPKAYFSGDDVTRASYRLRSGKAPDHLANCPEMLHQMPLGMTNVLAELFTARAANKGYKATQPYIEELVQIYCIAKHSAAEQPKDCRPIAVGFWLGKLYTYALMEKGLMDTEERASTSAHGFRKGFQAGEVLYITQQIGEKMTEWSQGFCAAKIDFTKAYAMDRKHLSTYATRRVWRVMTMAAPSSELPGDTTTFADDYPFDIKPDNLLTVKDVVAMHRDHYEGTPYDMTKGLAGGPYGDPSRFDPSGTIASGVYPPEDQISETEAWAATPIAVSAPAVRKPRT